MYRLVTLVVLLCAPVTAFAQALVDPAASPPTPPVADEPLPLDQAREAPAANNPLDRIERRLDQIENRLDQSNPSPAVAQPEAIPEPAAQPEAATDNTWRYRNYNGAWWYWLPSNRWVYWSNGAWVDPPENSSVPTLTPTYTLPAVRYTVPVYSYRPSYTSYYPSYGYSSYYPSYGYGGYGRYGGYGGYHGGHGIAIGLSFGGGHHHHGGHYHGGYGHGGHGHGGHGHGGHHHH
jgi:hypothetical protein